MLRILKKMAGLPRNDPCLRGLFLCIASGMNEKPVKPNLF